MICIRNPILRRFNISQFYVSRYGKLFILLHFHFIIRERNRACKVLYHKKGINKDDIKMKKEENLHKRKPNIPILLTYQNLIETMDMLRDNLEYYFSHNVRIILLIICLSKIYTSSILPIFISSGWNISTFAEPTRRNIATQLPWFISQQRAVCRIRLRHWSNHNNVSCSSTL